MATGDKFMKEINDQFLICKICFEPFRDPKTLVCLHTFCCACLQRHQEAENARPSRYAIFSRYVSCPLCRRKTEIPTGGIRRLQDNFLVSNLTEIVNRKGRASVPSCEICHTIRPRSNEACCKCLDCSKLLCKACVELHHKTKVTMKHSLIDLEGEKDIECKAHPEETVRFYCQPCDACICVVCTFQEHRGHDVASFSEGFQKHREELEGLVTRCRERQTSVENRLKLVDKYENLLKDVRDRIRDLAISYIAQVRSTERELMRKVDEIFGGGVVEFMQHKSWLQENFDSLQSSCSLTEIILKDKGVEVLLLKKELQTKLSQLLEASLPDIPDGLPDKVNFVPGTVKLGYIAISKEAQDGEEILKPVSDKESDPEEKLPNDMKALDMSYGNEKPSIWCQETQTDHHERVDGITTMECDVTIREVCGCSQTDEVRRSSRETNTERVLMLERGTVAYSADTRNKGTMTERKSFRSLKSQTPRTITYEQETSTSTSVTLTDVAVMTSLVPLSPPTVSKAQQASPRTATKLTNTIPRDSTEVGLGTDISLGGLDLGADSATMDWLQRMLGSRETLVKSSLAASQATVPSTQSSSSSSSSSPPFNRFLYRPRTVVEGLSSQTEKTPPGGVTDGALSPHTSPIIGAHGFSRHQVEPTYKVDQGSMTPFKVRIVPEMTEKETSPEKIKLTDGATMTSCDVTTTSTQTPVKRFSSVAMGTDYSGQSDKGTCTPTPQSAEAGTSMPHVTYDSKITWTEHVETTERAVNACAEMSDAGSGSASVSTGDCGVQVRPGIRICATNTPRVRHVSHETQTPCDISNDATKPYSGDGPPPMPPVQGPLPGRAATLPRRRKSCVENAEKSVGTEAVAMETKATDTVGVVPLSHSATETTPTAVCERATATSQVHMSDEWTLTPAPQLIHTGVSPHCPATMETGVSTTAIVTMEQATYTEVVTLRETGTEAVVEQVDGETLTDRQVLRDAQTGHELTTEDSQTSTDFLLTTDTAVMTDPSVQQETSPLTESKAVQIRPAQSSRKTNTPHPATRGAESQTDFSTIDCAVCEHQAAAWEEAAAKQFTDSCTEPHPPATCDVGTMALSVLSATETSPAHTQTTPPQLLDKNLNTSIDLEENEADLREYRDAATSTESLPYIGLLSDLDVDELIVVPEAAFDLVSDPDSCLVETAEAETLTDTLLYVDCGVQTLLTFTPPDPDGSDVRAEGGEGHTGRHVVSVGVNTASKMTFEKETCTPSRHLFSKGTMTFYVAKRDKSTSTPGQSRGASLGDGRGSGVNARTGKDASACKVHVEDKVTMTPVPELRDVSVETESRMADGRISECISKLRSVSERLNSPTQRPPPEGDVFFGAAFPARGQDSWDRGQRSPASTQDGGERPLSPTSPRGDRCEEERQRQLQKLLEETKAILKVKDGRAEGAGPVTGAVRKAQPITTLRGRGQDRTRDCGPGYQTRSLPRQFSVDGPCPVRLGSQSANPASRLPLLRYNSAPGRIATVPAQKLINSGGPRPPAPKQPSPSRIPVSQKSGDASPPPPQHAAHVETFPPGPKTIKSPQKPPLPAITETRTPSSCSDSSTASFLSAHSGDNASLAPSLEPRCPSPSPSSATTSSEVTDSTLEKSSGETTATSTETVGEKTTAKKGGLGFMQRLLSKKKKHDTDPRAPSAPASSAPPAKPVPKVPAPKPAPPSPPKPDIPRKPKGFVYVRQRIFSIQHDNEDEREFYEKKQREQGQGQGAGEAKEGEEDGARCLAEVKDQAVAVKAEDTVKQAAKPSKEKGKVREVKEKSKGSKEKDKAREKREKEMEKARAREKEKEEKREKEKERKAKAMKKKTEKVPLSPVCQHGRRRPGGKADQPSTSTANGAATARSPLPSRK